MLQFILYFNFYFYIQLNKYCKKEVYCCYRYCSKLFSKIRKETEFWQHRCWNCKKKYERKKSWVIWLGGRKKWISIMRFSKFLSCSSSTCEVPQCMLGGVLEWFTNCGNQVAEIVKNWGERKYEFWQPSCQKWEKKIMVTEI